MGEQIIQSLPGQNAVENNLGTFKGFATDKETLVQKYDGGATVGCPSETPRSSFVKFACGDQVFYWIFHLNDGLHSLELIILLNLLYVSIRLSFLFPMFVDIQHFHRHLVLLQNNPGYWN